MEFVTFFFWLKMHTWTTFFLCPEKTVIRRYFFYFFRRKFAQILRKKSYHFFNANIVNNWWVIPVKIIENSIEVNITSQFSIFFFFFLGDEMFSDSYKMRLIDDVMYEVYGKLISRADGDIQLDGANPSAEEADEGTDANVQTGVDIVMNSRLCETGFSDKKSFTVYLKDYMKK